MRDRRAHQPSESPLASIPEAVPGRCRYLRGSGPRTPTSCRVGCAPASSSFTVHDEPGDLLPELDDATTGLITTAIWLGVSSGYLDPAHTLSTTHHNAADGLKWRCSLAAPSTATSPGAARLGRPERRA